MPDLFDVIELTVDIPERGLRAGMQGTIVEYHSNNAYEVEFANEQGETVDFLALYPNQFIVVWRAKNSDMGPTRRAACCLGCQSVEGGRLGSV